MQIVRSNLVTKATLALTIAAAVVVPRPAGGFFQRTTLEGLIGNDVGGVWLSVHHLLPTFRLRLDRAAEDRPAPFDVGPISDELANAFPDAPAGVEIVKFDDPGFSARFGIFAGDVITKVNTIEVANVEEYEAALKEVKEWFMITIRRGSLRFSSARLMKFEYNADESLEDGVSVPVEKFNVRVVDGDLPFGAELLETRRTHEFFELSDEHREALTQNWHRLPIADNSPFVNGEHRVVTVDLYDKSLRDDKTLDGSVFAIVSQLKGNPLAGGGGATIGVYGVRDIGEKSITGSYVESTMASAPFPISIEFHGSFEMTRIDDFSNKDSEFRIAEAKKKRVHEEGDDDDVELAPDIPEDLDDTEHDDVELAE